MSSVNTIFQNQCIRDFQIVIISIIGNRNIQRSTFKIVTFAFGFTGSSPKLGRIVRAGMVEPTVEVCVGVSSRLAARRAAEYPQFGHAAVKYRAPQSGHFKPSVPAFAPHVGQKAESKTVPQFSHRYEKFTALQAIHFVSATPLTVPQYLQTFIFITFALRDAPTVAAVLADRESLCARHNSCPFLKAHHKQFNYTEEYPLNNFPPPTDEKPISTALFMLNFIDLSNCLNSYISTAAARTRHEFLLPHFYFCIKILFRHYML